MVLGETTPQLGEVIADHGGMSNQPGGMSNQPMGRPALSAPLRILFEAPSWLYRWHLGWLFGHRFLVLTYRGRRTGRTLRTVLEVIQYDRATPESVVMSAYGSTAGWYLSILSTPALRVQTGRLITFRACVY